MRTQTGSGRYILAGRDFASQYERRVREMQRQLDADEKADQMRRAYDQAMRRASGVGSDRQVPNVVGGSLDGASIPSGTQHGQTYRWDARSQRWVHVS